MGQLMDQGLAAPAGRGRKYPSLEENIFPDGESTGTDGAAEFIGPVIGMNSHIRKIGPQHRFAFLAEIGWQRSPAAALLLDLF